MSYLIKVHNKASPMSIWTAGKFPVSKTRLSISIKLTISFQVSISPSENHNEAVEHMCRNCKDSSTRTPDRVADLGNIRTVRRHRSEIGQTKFSRRH